MNLCHGIWFTIKRLSILICHLFSNACFPARSTTNIPRAPQPNYFPFCLTAKSSIKVPKRLCSVAMKTKNKQTKKSSFSTHDNTVVICWEVTPPDHWAISSNQTKLAAWLSRGHEQQTCAYLVFILGLKGNSICRMKFNLQGAELYDAYICKRFCVLLWGIVCPYHSNNWQIQLFFSSKKLITSCFAKSKY